MILSKEQGKRGGIKVETSKARSDWKRRQPAVSNFFVFSNFRSHVQIFFYFFLHYIFVCIKSIKYCKIYQYEHNNSLHLTTMKNTHCTFNNI